MCGCGVWCAHAPFNPFKAASARVTRREASRPPRHLSGCSAMSKPKFQTEWEEIDEEHQQLQVMEKPFEGVRHRPW